MPEEDRQDSSPEPLEGSPFAAGGHADTGVTGVAAPLPAGSPVSHADLLRQVVERLPAGAVWVEGDRVYFNRAAAEITGYGADELRTIDDWFVALYGEREAEIRRRYELHRESGLNERAPVQLRRKDGEERIIEFAAHQFDDHEVWLMDDVTERVRAEAALRESEDRLRTVVDTAVEGIITIDRAGIVQSFNRAAEGMFGYAADEVIGHNVGMLMTSPHREEHDGYIERYVRTGEARIIGIGREVIARRKDGSVFPIELAVGESDRLRFFTGVIRDISDRKTAEERLRQADRLSAIGTLAAGLGHDMSNLLLPVRARLDLIEDADLDPGISRHFIEIRKSTNYLQDLADGLHLLALDPDDREASNESTVLADWWEQVRNLLARALPKQVRFAASIPANLPAIGAAPHGLTQAVLNMLVNSAQAVGADGRVRLWAEADDGNHVVRLGVTDDGCGMTPDVTRRALEPFFTTKTRGLGTGLGLSLVHGVVLAAGGSVDIDSEPGRGTTIVLTFPAVPFEPADESPAGLDQAPIAVVSVADPRTESLVENLLEMAGFDVATDVPASPADVSLWIMDSRAGALNAMRDRGGSDRRVIILGQAPPEWTGRNGSVIEDPDDFDKLRAAIHQAANEVSP